MDLLHTLPFVAPEAFLTLQVGAAVIYFLASAMEAEETGLTVNILTLSNGWRDGIFVAVLRLAFGSIATLAVNHYCLREGKLAKYED